MLSSGRGGVGSASDNGSRAVDDGTLHGGAADVDGDDDVRPDRIDRAGRERCGAQGVGAWPSMAVAVEPWPRLPP
ncbi:hypothetical protein DFJ65_1784 [Calidifontibacter indicus]|uniref:Uncharacterized protein n=1 Tax=Calidifontibacter indicus TaxID=419650 RepID=A0A3D9UVX9_9MICO|nr:hypothetical protein DFJ65_1784 [Calidifontibacter indicus]